MRRSIVALISILGLVALGACSNDRETTAPRYIAPSRGISADVIPVCSSSLFSTMQRDAGAYFPSGDRVFGLINDMKTAFRTSLAAATPIGFDILTDLAAVRDAGLQIGTAAAGGRFADEVVGCMDVGTVPSKFLAASALANGVFEVRGATGPTAAATAFTSTPGSTHAAAPLWGAEPSGSSWTRSGAGTYGRYLVYGYPLGPDVRTSGFELGTLPTSLSNFLSNSTDAFRVGLCISQANVGAGVANRLLHAGAIVADPNSILTQGTQFCYQHITSLGTTTWYASLVRRATSLLAPKLLLAQGFYDGIGGLPDGWSPFNPNALAGNSINLIYLQPPTNDTVNTNFTPTVTVKAFKLNGPNDTLFVPGVAVTISITGNQGSPDILSNRFATTGTNGIASFPTLQVNKAGGYSFTASGLLSGVPTQSVVSPLFNIKNR